MVNKEMTGLYNVLLELGWSGSRAEVGDVCRKMFESYNWNFGAAVAQQWGRNYFKGKENALKEAVVKDLALFKQYNFNLDKVAEHK